MCAMSEKPINEKESVNENKEPVDESKVDWSTLGEDWGKLYFGKDETPPELMKRMGSNELLNVLNSVCPLNH